MESRRTGLARSAVPAAGRTGIGMDLPEPVRTIMHGERTGNSGWAATSSCWMAWSKPHLGGDYAIAMVDELENPQHIRQRFTVGY